MTKESIKGLCKVLALMTFVVGGVGSYLCVPAAFSTDLTWIAMAGVYFVAGAIMITGGLLSYSVLLKTE